VSSERTILSSLAEKVAPDHTALLLIDMVNDFAHPKGKAAVQGNRPLDHIRSIIPTLQALLDGARTAGVLVVHVQHTTLPGAASDSDVWLEARRRAKYSAVDVCIEGTWGHESIDELRPVGGEPEVPKYRYGGFEGTNLARVLRSAEVKTVICCGASTNVCVEATAREAFARELYVVLPADGCASWSRPLHEASLESAANRYATICNAEDILTIWDAGGSRAGQ
jgi:ureidoacrylate peracid hydrolase